MSPLRLAFATVVVIGVVVGGLIVGPTYRGSVVPAAFPSPNAVQVPGQVAVQLGAVTGPETYRAAMHQSTLTRPTRWCVEPRPNEPLLREALGTAATVWSLNNMTAKPAASAILITDERICERAAKAYDDTVWSGGVTVDEHLALAPVLVVVVGDLYLVDDGSDRNGFWNVNIFDANWNELLGSYGGGA